jgi:hypothetical protein
MTATAIATALLLLNQQGKCDTSSGFGAESYEYEVSDYLLMHH